MTHAIDQHPHALYLVGEPASGKSTAFAALTRHCTARTHKQPVAHTIWQPPTRGGVEVMEIGARREQFSGTDALAMNGVVGAEQLILLKRPPLVMAEGDRLANRRWFDFLQAQGYTLWICVMNTSELKMSDRRLERALMDGNYQDPTWLKGRKTGVENLLKVYPHYVINGEVKPEFVADQIARIALPFAHLLAPEVVHA